MNLDERRAELLIWLADGPCIEAIADNWLCEVAQLEAENERLRKIEYAANAAYNCWAGEGKASPQLMEALRKALGGDDE